ncbi:MAG: hypothetical protein WA081_05880 [Desulfosalsimonadaceae bacterium]
MGAHRKKLYIICIHDEWGLSHSQFTKLKSAIGMHQPDYWEFFNPGTISIFFKDTKKGSNKASSLMKTLQDIKNDKSGLDKIGIGNSEGEMVFETNEWGKILSTPLGGAANEAIAKAKNMATVS